MAEKVRVRFAPSPTGYLHIGGVRTAIFNYLFARHHRGTFILRIEDTDRQRSTLEAVEQILDSLRWLALDWDEGPYFQSERTEIYREHLERLLSEAKAYRCYCRPEELEAKRRKAEAEKGQYKYDGTCRNRDPKEDPAGRSFTVRFRTSDVVPDHFNDLVLGRLPIDQAKLDDWILARSDGSPTYNFCVVVDDATMRISHVIRGNDHVQNTPRQILLYRALGYPVPQLAHMSLTHGPDGSKLSKRREEEYRKLGISVSMQEYRRMGYLPDALVNYLSRLGWSYGDQEIFTRRELQEKFDLEHVGKSAGIMNPDKLKWLNAHYIKETDDAALAQMLLPFLTELGVQTEADSRLHRVARCLKERSKTLGEMARSAMIFFRPPETYDPKAEKKWFKPGVETLLARVRSLVQSADLNDEQAMEDAFRTLAEQLTKGKLGEVAQPVRLALTGTTVSPSLFTVMSILGRAQILKRLDRALAEQEAHPERT